MNGRIQIRVDGLPYAPEDGKPPGSRKPPVPQGSKGAYIHGKRAIVFDTNATRLEPWRNHVRDIARDQARYHDTITDAFKAWMRFTFERPPGHYRTGRNAHRLKDSSPTLPTGHDLGDLDKLQRAVFDALQAAEVIADDCLCVDVRARKVYAGEDELALPAAGVVIVLEPLTQTTGPVTLTRAQGEGAEEDVAGSVHPAQETLL